MGMGSSCLLWEHGADQLLIVATLGHVQGIQLLSEYIGAESTVSTQGQGVQLLTVGTWGQGDLVAYSGYMGGRDPAAYSGYMGEGVQLLIEGTCGQGIQLLTVGT